MQDIIHIASPTHYVVDDMIKTFQPPFRLVSPTHNIIYHHTDHSIRERERERVEIFNIFNKFWKIDIKIHLIIIV